MAEVFISLKQLPGPGLRAKARKRCVAEGSRSLSPSPCRRREELQRQAAGGGGGRGGRPGGVGEVPSKGEGSQLELNLGNLGPAALSRRLAS